MELIFYLIHFGQELVRSHPRTSQVQGQLYPGCSSEAALPRLGPYYSYKVRPGLDMGTLSLRARSTGPTWQELRQQGASGGDGAVGKLSLEYSAQFIGFIQPFGNND
jgi:hypothetical protein